MRIAIETGTTEQALAPEQHEAVGEPEALALALETSELAPEQLWGESSFVNVLLPEKSRAATGMPRCTTLRQLLQAAHTHRQHLLLPADLFFNWDIRVALGSPDALHVCIESIIGIRDPNRSGHDRIYLLVYQRCGAVTRHHPGGTPAQSARVHTIPHHSRTYDRNIALNQGVGAALHVHAPGSLLTETETLVTSEDLAEIKPVDSKLVNAASLRAALSNLRLGETDWSREGFPWWVFMAGHEKFNTIVQAEITRVSGVSWADGHLCMQVATRESVHVVTVNNGRARVDLA